jgi:SAM-dependent methyltransferase
MSASEVGTMFNATRAAFVRISPLVWAPAGQSLTYQLQLRPGEFVLDVCSGTGASAIPAAMCVGPNGRVHAVDLADDLLEEGRLVATARALQNIDFVAADATTWEPPSSISAAGYDVIASAYGVFFLADMDSAVRGLLRLLRPGGRFGVAVWRRDALESFNAAFFESVGRYRGDGGPAQRTPTGAAARRQGERLETAAQLADWLSGFGGRDVVVQELSNLVPSTAEFCWDIVLGSGLRGALAGFDDQTTAAVRADFLGLLTERAVHTVDLGTLVGTATIPGAGK